MNWPTMELMTSTSMCHRAISTYPASFPRKSFQTLGCAFALGTHQCSFLSSARRPLVGHLNIKSYWIEPPPSWMPTNRSFFFELLGIRIMALLNSACIATMRTNSGSSVTVRYHDPKILFYGHRKMSPAKSPKIRIMKREAARGPLRARKERCQTRCEDPGPGVFS